MKKSTLSLLIALLVGGLRAQNHEWVVLPDDGNWHLMVTFTGDNGNFGYYYNYTGNGNASSSSGSFRFSKILGKIFPFHQNYGNGQHGHPDVALVGMGATSQVWVRSRTGFGGGTFGVLDIDGGTPNMGSALDANLEDNGGTVSYLQNLPQNSFVVENISGFVIGDAGIGTTDTKGYRLAVNGNILAKEIKVEANPWPDYVFGEDYQLPDLSELSEYIKTNRHLPGMPSAREVEAEGVNLGEMNRLLLEKVEELTLHLIEKDQQVRQLKEQRAADREALDSLSDRMEALVSKIDIQETSRKKAENKTHRP